MRDVFWFTAAAICFGFSGYFTLWQQMPLEGIVFALWTLCALVRY